jgi:hypothetical protein
LKVSVCPTLPFSGAPAKATLLTVWLEADAPPEELPEDAAVFADDAFDEPPPEPEPLVPPRDPPDEAKEPETDDDDDDDADVEEPPPDPDDDPPVWPPPLKPDEPAPEPVEALKPGDEAVPAPFPCDPPLVYVNCTGPAKPDPVATVTFAVVPGENPGAEAVQLVPRLLQLTLLADAPLK